MLENALNYLKFRKGAVSKYKVHSPFVFDFISEVLENKGEYYCYKSIELVRSKNLMDHSIVHVTDLGAGSKKLKSAERKVSSIAKTSLKSEKHAQLLFRIANYFQFESVLELGTSLGITTSYIAKANKKAQVVTLEGCPEISKVAKKNFDRLGVQNVIQVVGDFAQTLPEVLKKNEPFDAVFFDGNHVFEPTMSYFNQVLEHKRENSVFIFDDIYWSKEMSSAWDKIKSHPDVTLTIDLFQLGLVFFRKDIEKQDFKLVF